MSKKYSKQSLIDAINSAMDSKEAANFYHVPASTIRRHRRNRSLRSRIGRPSYLSSNEESYFVALLQLLPDFGFPVTCEVALKLANDYFKSLGLSDNPGKKWLRSFVQRHHEDIKWKKQSKLEQAREQSFTEEVRLAWFNLLENVMIKYGLLDKPCQIFNVDETGFSDQTKGEYVIVKSSQRHVFEANGGTGKHCRTALICVSAGGVVLSPLFLYSGQHLMDAWCAGGPDGAHYGVTAKGWMDTVMFEYWLESSTISHSSNDSYNTATSTYSSFLNSIIIDGHDDLSVHDNATYTDLKPCSLDYSCELSRSLAVTGSVDQQETAKNHQNNLFTTIINNNSPPNPIVAVRQVVNEVLSSYQEKKCTTTTSSKVHRASRLRSTVGLNITDDDFVLLKLKEREEKKNKMKKARSSKAGKPIKISTNKATNKKSKTTSFSADTTNKENEIPKDVEVEYGIQLLQHAINVSQFESMSDSSNEEC
ncbi:unnamed protein product [Rotaria sordida]|uniref:HTH CENPB-type domain-containing protein n=1 Tax=Rotaria sordida TaxID=392033 RepID=A0A820AY13_9BILA|nr:unnamed protein product [Rotaria sordida]CAF4198921.1 unnamed protein product [Rotaria sordida]